MYYSNGFVYGGYPEAPIKIESVKPLSDMMMLVSFNNGEKGFLMLHVWMVKCLNQLKRKWYSGIA